MNKAAKVLITIVAVAAMVGVFTYLSMRPASVSCEVCIEFRGNTDCRKAAGKDKEEAQMSATSTACGSISGGVGEGIACRNTVPKSVTCTER